MSMSLDNKSNFEVSELQEYETDNNHGSTKSIIGLGTRQQAWKTTTPIFLALLLIVLVLILILQSITVYHLKANPAAVCPEATTSASNTGDTGALTGGGNSDGATTSECHINVTELLTRLNQAINNIEDSTTSIIEKQEMCNETESTDSTVILTDIVGSLSVIKDNSITTEGVVNDIAMGVEELLKLHNTSSDEASPLHIYTSCQNVKESQPNSLSGYYHINDKIVYCEFGKLCGSEGGWTRLGYLDMSDSTVNCPTGFRLYEVSGVRACGRPNGGASCASVKFPSNGISYSEVCGRVIGYQYASTDGVDTRFISTSIHNNINSYYVDGVSITQGFPRKHIWTLMAGLADSNNHDKNGNCPCNTPPGNTQQLQSFIGNNYFCESGNPSTWTYKFYSTDPLWDGKGCGSHETNCCSAPGLPWFHRTLTPTAEYLELRVCCDQFTSDEDVPITLYELYVK